MNTVEFESGAVCIDATIIATEFAIEPALIHHLLRRKKITSLFERGVDQDVGRYRLTFFHGNQCLRLLTDAAGNIIERTVTDRDERQPP